MGSQDERTVEADYDPYTQGLLDTSIWKSSMNYELCSTNTHEHKGKMLSLASSGFLCV